MSCDLRIAYERPSAVSTAWRVVQWTYRHIGVVSSTMWRACSDLIFHRATTQSRISRKDRLRQKRPAAAKRPASFGQNHPRLRISVFWRIRGCGYGCIRIRFSHYRDYDLLHAAVPWPMLIAAYSTWLSPGQPAKNWSLIINTMSNDICI